jgi:acyl carrier protein
MSLTKLKEAFVESLSLPPDTMLEELTYRSVPEWDSVAHMQLVANIETCFDIMLEAEDVLDMSSFHKAVEILKKYGVQCDGA